MKKYCVYAHYTLNTNELFYIGKGTKKRANENSGRNNYWSKVYKKYGKKVEILIDNLEESDAFIQEILAIKELSPRCNITKGGEGVSGVKQTKEHIKKRALKSSIAQKGKPRNTIGKRHGMFGKNHSIESLIKNAKSNGTKPFYAIKDNTYYGPFLYRKQCSETLGIKASPNIGSCLSGKLKSYKGYKFIHVLDGKKEK